MSMNLAFVTKSGNMVSFPFQSPTKLTYAFFAEANTERRLSLVDDQLKLWGWSADERHVVLENIASLLNDESFTLTII